MEKITYRKTLDVHKNGTQFTLQGFQTADKMSRVIEISLMASGDAIDFPLEGIQAVMYVSTPGAETPSRIECDIKDNKIIYNVLPITEEGTIIMQLKLIETSPGTSVLYSPKFAVEVSKSDGDVNDAEGSDIYTKFEKTIQKADKAYNKAMTNFVLSADGIITITYRDGSTYESDFLKRINIGDNAALSESYAKGTAGVRQGEETDNAKYYSNVAKSEALNAKNIMSESRDVLDEVRLHGAYTAFSVNFDTGEAEYLNPAFTFNIDEETGELNAECKDTMFDGEIASYIDIWLEKNGFKLKEMQDLTSQNTNDIKKNKSDISILNARSDVANARLNSLETETLPIERGGTGAITKGEALANLGGVPFEYVDQKVYIGQYVGKGMQDGQTTKDVSVRIHYNKIPKMIIIQGDTDPDNSNFAIYENNAIMIYGSNKVSLFPSITSSSAGIEMLTCTWTENSVTFYNEKRFRQLNDANITYRYVIFY